MHPDFRELVESLEPKLQELVSAKPVKFANLPHILPKRGIYLFSDGQNHLYVGRTNNLKNRLRAHCAATSTHKKAALAFRLARLATGKTKPSYQKKGSRDNLMLDTEFGAAFGRAKSLISGMDIRFVEESDPVKQALLEIYVATVLKTPHNDFENH